MLPKRSFSEKILAKASSKKFIQNPFVIPKTSLMNKELLGQLPYYLEYNAKRGPKTELSIKNVKTDKEKRKNEKFRLKKTNSEFNLKRVQNGLRKNENKDSTENCQLLKLTKKSKSTQKLTLNNRLYQGTNKKPLLDIFDKMNDKENQVNNLRKADNPFGPVIINKHRKTNRESNRKTKRNIISFDPIKNKEKNQIKNEPNMPQSISREDYLDLLMENMMLKKKYEESRKMESFFFKKINNIKRKGLKQEIKLDHFKKRFTHNQEKNIEVMPLKRTTYGNHNSNPSQNVVSNLFQTPNPKNNMCVNYINNNYHLNFSGKKNEDDQDIPMNNVQSIKKQINKEWKEKLLNCMAKFQMNKKNNTQIKGVLHSPKARPPHTDFIMKKSNHKKPIYCLFNETRNRGSSKKPKPLIAKNFLEDSTTQQEHSQESECEQEKRLPVRNDRKGTKDNFNFTFSNFKALS